MRKHQIMRAFRSELFAGLFLIALGCGASDRQASQCSLDQLRGGWHLVMADPESIQVLTGLVELSDSSGQTNLVAKSREGTGEIVDYPIENVMVRSDSISFAFAPIRYELHGQCFSADSLGGEYAVRLFQDTASVRGTWVMTRAKPR